MSRIPHFHHSDGLFEHAAALDAAVDMFDAYTPTRELPIPCFLDPRQLVPTGLLRGLKDVHTVQREGLKSHILQQLTPRRQGIGRGISDALVMDTARMGLTQEEDVQGLIDQEQVFQRVPLFLAAITRFLFGRVRGRGMDRSVPHDKKGGCWGWERLAPLPRGGCPRAGGYFHSQACAQGLQLATGRMAQGTPRVAQHRQENMNPLGRVGLAHAKQAALQQLRGILLEIDENKQQPIFRGWQGTVLIRRITSRLPAPHVQGPVGRVPQERYFKWGYQRL